MRKKEQVDNRFKHSYGVRDVIYYYKRTFPNKLDCTGISKVLNLFNSALIENMYKGAYITMPFSLGDLFIYKYKPKVRFTKEGEIDTYKRFKSVDYKATNELWKDYPEFKGKKYITYDNFHTDGYKFKIHWKRYNVNRKNRLYNLIPARTFSRGLAEYLRKNPNQSYYDK